MTWFKHKHWWVRKDYHAVKAPTGGNASVLVLEECTCGAVRTIQYAPGGKPVVRYSEVTGETP